MATKMEILKLKYFGSQAKSVHTIIIVNFQYFKKILIILHKQLINYVIKLLEV